MAPQRNFSKEQERLIGRLPKEGPPPTLLLHACCAPCSSAVLERLAPYFAITLLYYNPNIAPFAEYQKREAELRRLVAEMDLPNPVSFLPCAYDGEAFEAMAQGLEDAPEGGARCIKCYRLRLREAARAAGEGGFDYFTTTLSISPLKNAPALNQIGEEVGEEFGVKHLPSDFKKKDGYKRSVELSHQFGLYRQDYCGCVYSQRERARQQVQTEKGRE